MSPGFADICQLIMLGTSLYGREIKENFEDRTQAGHVVPPVILKIFETAVYRGLGSSLFSSDKNFGQTCLQ